MTFRRAIINGLLALVIGTVMGSFSAAISRAIQDGSGSYALANAFWLGGGGLVVGFPFVLLYGVPLYALLHRFRLANFISALAFGAVPGVVAWWRNDLIWQAVLMHGVAIALVFHLLMVSGGPIGSVKPKQVRGSP
jgi:hypothetical protein